MRQKFLKRYQKEWDVLLKNYPIANITEQPTNPLLLNVPASYFAADCRVMVFGQETNDWEGAFPHQGGVESMLNAYEGFYTEGQCYCYGGQWWNGINKLVGALEANANASGKTIAVLWNNLIKIGKAKEKGMPDEAIREWQCRWFEVIGWEVKELKPNLVAFFSGPHYDWFIKRIFSDAEFQRVNGRTARQFARVRSRHLPFDSIRTYHPNYLWRHGFYERMAEIVGTVQF